MSTSTSQPYQLLQLHQQLQRQPQHQHQHHMLHRHRNGTVMTNLKTPRWVCAREIFSGSVEIAGDAEFMRSSSKMHPSNRRSRRSTIAGATTGSHVALTAAPGVSRRFLLGLARLTGDGS